MQDPSTSPEVRSIDTAFNSGYGPYTVWGIILGFCYMVPISWSIWSLRYPKLESFILYPSIRNGTFSVFHYSGQTLPHPTNKEATVDWRLDELRSRGVELCW